MVYEGDMELVHWLGTTLCRWNNQLIGFWLIQSHWKVAIIFGGHTPKLAKQLQYLSSLGTVQVVTGDFPGLSCHMDPCISVLVGEASILSQVDHLISII